MSIKTEFEIPGQVKLLSSSTLSRLVYEKAREVEQMERQLQAAREANGAALAYAALGNAECPMVKQMIEASAKLVIFEFDCLREAKYCLVAYRAELQIRREQGTL